MNKRVHRSEGNCLHWRLKIDIEGKLIIDWIENRNAVVLRMTSIERRASLNNEEAVLLYDEYIKWWIVWKDAGLLITLNELKRSGDTRGYYQLIVNWKRTWSIVLKTL